MQTDVFVAAIPIGHRLAAQPTVSLADLAGEPFIHYAANAVPGLHALTMLLFQSIGQFPRAAQSALQVETVICLVESGLGVAIVPSCCMRQKSDHCVFRELSPLPATATSGIAIVYDPDYELAAARHFRAMAVQLASRRPETPAK